MTAAVAFASPAVATRSGKPIKPPVIHEDFIPLLPCNQDTTIGMEGCGERLTLARDKRIDREVALIFKLLGSNAPRRDLAAAQTAWLKYRSADCTSQSDVFKGGSLALVVYVGCFANDDLARIADLKLLYKDLVEGRTVVPPFP